MYFSAEPETALREVLQNLRPDIKAVAELIGLFGPNSTAVRELRKVKLSEQGHRALAFADIACADDVIDLRDVTVRSRVERGNAMLLAAHGVIHLDVARHGRPSVRVLRARARGLDLGADHDPRVGGSSPSSGIGDSSRLASGGGGCGTIDEQAAEQPP